MTISLTRQLCRILGRDVRAADRRRAALHVLDWVGCAAIGAVTPAGRVFAEPSALFGNGPCHGVGVGGSCAPAQAAFVNGGLGNVLEMDDVHRTAILHPGPVVIPAVLAAAEADGLTGAAFLDAVVRGYEAMIRVGRSVGPTHYVHWHNTGSCGPFGAAAGAAFAFGLDADAVVSALGNAGSTAGGLWRCRHEPVMTKQWHTAKAAADGLAAAVLARQGLTGPEYILEGEQGFYSALAPDATPMDVVHDDDAPWLIYDTSFKPWPACRHAHAAIDAALLAREDLGDTADIVSVAVETYDDAIRFCDNPRPQIEIEAKFSLQHAVAVTLSQGAPDLADFRPDRLDLAPIADLRCRVTVGTVASYAAAYPAHYGAGLRITLTDGTERRFDVLDALGDPDNPLDDGAICAKARGLMAAAGMPAAAIDAMIDRCLDLPDAADVTTFSACLPAREDLVHGLF